MLLFLLYGSAYTRLAHASFFLVSSCLSSELDLVFFYQRAGFPWSLRFGDAYLFLSLFLFMWKQLLSLLEEVESRMKTVLALRRKCETEWPCCVEEENE
jgi:hypothetical protein